MTKVKKVTLNKKIKAAIIQYIIKQGGFDYWLDGYEAWPIIAETCQCSYRYVKKVFFNELYWDKHFHKWIQDYYEY